MITIGGSSLEPVYYNRSAFAVLREDRQHPIWWMNSKAAIGASHGLKNSTTRQNTKQVAS
jgi:hypothetical protein